MMCESRGSKAARMAQAQEAVARVKVVAPEGEIQPSTEIDLFISTEKIMVLNTDLQRISDTDVRQVGVLINSVQETTTTTEATAGTTRLKRDRTIWPREKDTAPLSFTGHNFAEFPISDTMYLETNITIEFR
ncbi:hypothetical protein COOONC_12380 [Cooperia oncophora]